MLNPLRISSIANCRNRRITLNRLTHTLNLCPSCKMVTVNRLYQSHGLKTPLESSTCIGRGKAKSTCEHAIVVASWSAALTGLKHMFNALDECTGPRRLPKDLETVAQLLQGRAQELQEKLGAVNAHSTAEQHQKTRERTHQQSPQARERFHREETPHRQETSHRQETAHRHHKNRPTSPAAVPPLASYRDEDLLAELTKRYHAQSQVVSSIRSILDNYDAREKHFLDASDAEAEDEDEDEDSCTEEPEWETEDEHDDSGAEESD